jgi:hypothetical protein
MLKIHTPFADELELEAIGNEMESASIFNNEQYAGYSPFNSTNEAESIQEGEWETDPLAQQYFEMLNELHDNEFESAIDNLVTELQEHLGSFEAATPFLNESATLQLATNYLNPILNESNQLFETMAAELEALPLNQMNEMELENAMDSLYLNRESNFTPAQEFFFKKLANKAKAVIKKVVKVVGKISPLHKILGKLKEIVGPLIKQVLNKLLNKLPVEIQDLAKELARKLFKKKDGEPVDVEGDSDSTEDDSQSNNSPEEEQLIGNDGQIPTNYPSQNIQAEFDHYVSRLVSADTEMEQNNIIAEYEQSANTEHENDLRDITVAREQFINELENLKEGEDPTPALENFLPVMMKAAMKTLKIAIKITNSRPKIVEFLAGLMSKWISKYIGEEKAKKLSLVVADKGLKLLKLETPEHENDNSKQVYEAIANTIEEVTNKISTLSDEVISDPELLTHETYQAFESAASAYFPDNAIKYEARESETGDGYWQSKGKYLKHSKVFETTLNLNQLKNVETFGGIKLSNFVSDSLGLKTDVPIKAKIHLFQAKKGCTISGITLNEKNIPGLGSASRKVYNQIHVLDKNAASVILGQPDLGKNVRPMRNRNRNLIFEGERFYYLQIQGSNGMQNSTTEDSANVDTVLQNSKPPLNMPSIDTVDVKPASRSTQINRIISGSLSQALVIKDIIYFSEADSRKILEALKKQSSSELYEYLKTLKPNFEKNFFGDKFKTGGIILKGIIDMAGKIIKENLSKTVLEKIKHHVDDFEKAVIDPKQGVTVIIGYRISLAKGPKLKLRLQQALSTVTINIIPGYTQKSSPVTSGKCPHCGNGNDVKVSPHQSPRTFYAAITPIRGNMIPVSKARFN